MDALISISNLSHAFGAGSARRVVLDKVSANFFPNEIVIMMGRSGAGKTTLLTLVGGLRSIQSGSVRVGGFELRDASSQGLRDVRRRVGFIFQTHNLIESLTALQNVQLALATDPGVTAQSSKKRALELLSLVGLEDYASKLPHQLSGGQKQRIAVARALMRSPEIILADEPTSALDGQSGRAIVKLIEHLARRIHCAVLLVTHDNRILDIADRVLTLEDGRVDETNLRMGRLVTEAARLMQLLSTYPQIFKDASQLTAPVAEFNSRALELRESLAAVAGQQGGPVSGQALHWITILEHLHSLNKNLQKFGAVVSRAPHEAEEFVEIMTVGLEFLLQTAASAAAAPSHTGAEFLGLLTSDNGSSVNSVRDEYMKLAHVLAGDGAHLAFELANLYLLLTFFLHEVAGVLKQEGQA